MRVSPWIARLLILAVTGLFITISMKFILTPQEAAAQAGIRIEPGLGFTNTRAGFGGFPLGLSVILLYCAAADRRLLAGVSMIAVIAAVLLAVRLYAAFHDHTMSESAHLLAPEVAIFVIATAVVWLERARVCGATASS